MTALGARFGRARHERHLEERVRGGVGLVILPVVSALHMGTTYPAPVRPVAGTEEDAVAPRQDSPAGIAHFDSVIPRLAGRAEAVRRGGAAVLGRLNHPGANRHRENPRPAVAPSQQRGEHPPNMPPALDAGGIAQLVRDYGEAARRAVTAGRPGIDIRAAHGYLIAQFRSPLPNHRHDGHGGSLGGRARFLEEVIGELRRRTRPNLVVRDRLAADGQEPAVARLLEDRVAFVNLSLGSFTGMHPGRSWQPYVAPFLVAEELALPFARAVRPSGAGPRHGRGADPGAGDRASRGRRVATPTCRLHAGADRRPPARDQAGRGPRRRHRPPRRLHGVPPAAGGHLPCQPRGGPRGGAGARADAAATADVRGRRRASRDGGRLPGLAARPPGHDLRGHRLPRRRARALRPRPRPGGLRSLLDRFRRDLATRGVDVHAGAPPASRRRAGNPRRRARSPSPCAPTAGSTGR